MAFRDLVTRAILPPSVRGVEQLETRKKQPFNLSSSSYRFGRTLGFSPLDTLAGWQANEVAYRCRDLWASELSARPLVLEDEDGIQEDDPICVRFNKSSSDAESAVIRNHVMWSKLIENGDAFIYMDRGAGGEGEPADFVVIMDDIEPLVADTFYDNDGETVRERTIREKISPKLAGFVVHTPDFGDMYLLPSEVLWLRLPDYRKPWQSEAPSRYAQMSAMLDDEARQWQYNELKNGARPSAVVNMGAGANPEAAQRFQAQLTAAISGSANAAHIAVVGGADGDKSGVERLSMSPQEMSYIESHAMNGRDICTAYGVPVDLVFGQSTFDNQDSAWKRFWNNGTAKLRLVSSEIDRQLFPEDSRTAIFDTRDVAALQENTDAIHQRAEKAWLANGKTLREYRADITADPLPDNDPRNEMFHDEFVASFKAANTPEQLKPFAGINNDPADDELTDEGETGNSEESKELVEEQRGVEFRTSGAKQDGVIASFWLNGEDAEALAIPGGEPAEQMHLTLAFLGTTETAGQKKDLVKAVTEFASSHGPILGKIAGRGVFDTPDGEAVIALVDAPALPEWRGDLVEAIEKAGLQVSRDHGFTPHVTLAYTEKGKGSGIKTKPGYELSWNTVTVAWGGEHISIPLVEQRAVAVDYDRIDKMLAQQLAAISPVPVVATSVSTTTSEVGNVKRAQALQDRHTRNIRLAVGRLADKQEKSVLRELKKLEGKRSKVITTRAEEEEQEQPPSYISAALLFAMSYWKDETKKALDTPMEGLYVDSALASVEELNTALPPDAKIVAKQDYLDRVVATMATRLDVLAGEITATTFKAIEEEILKPGILDKDGSEGTAKLSKRLTERFSDLKGYRAQAIARTEAHGGFNQVRYESHIESGVVRATRWVATNDDRVRQEHERTEADGGVNGEERPLEEQFSNGCLYPGDPAGPPASSINCRCETIALLVDDLAALTDNPDQVAA